MSDKNNLAEEAYTYIKEKLYNFDILPEQTVSDFLLSKQLNMSRTPIRQALQMLKNDGLLEEMPGSSSTYKVSAISEEEIQDIFDYREALELSALELASEKGRIDSRVIEKLQKNVDTMVEKQNAGKTEDHFDADQVFHSAIVHAAGNKRITLAYDALTFQLERLRLLTYLNSAFQDKASDEHQAIVSALKNKDYALASEKLKRHLETSRNDYIGIFNGDGLPGNALKLLQYLSTKINAKSEIS